MAHIKYHCLNLIWASHMKVYCQCLWTSQSCCVGFIVRTGTVKWQMAMIQSQLVNMSCWRLYSDSNILWPEQKWLPFCRRYFNCIFSTIFWPPLPMHELYIVATWYKGIYINQLNAGRGCVSVMGADRLRVPATPKVDLPSSASGQLCESASR